MTRVRLLDLLRRAEALSEGQRLILAGSQAFYAAAPAAPELVARSEEADVLLVGAERRLFQRLNEALGMESRYLLDTGVFAHPVGPGTITLVPGWEERLVPFGRDDGLANVWALEIHDLAASKLMAGRDKDLEFLRALLDYNLCDFSTLYGETKQAKLADLPAPGSSGESTAAAPPRRDRHGRRFSTMNPMHS